MRCKDVNEASRGSQRCVEKHSLGVSEIGCNEEIGDVKQA